MVPQATGTEGPCQNSRPGGARFRVEACPSTCLSPLLGVPQAIRRAHQWGFRTEVGTGNPRGGQQEACKW